MDGAGIMEQVMVDASSVRRGDEILIGGQAYAVVDMAALPRGGRRLEFASGESFTMRASTVMWATRRRVPARAGTPRRARPR
ncbi:hypothetical protein RM780_07905 [Streptomyces sp. DSM 44917]|uniref:Uncharacterized protein n=1 Tax=Streptomyces boetiae TaxID=3075541 RepID=A0ABU2L5Q4_9ACTN|nr:hypothetical protein [Streptomyces sp. DSM 44917]MDT0306886.1 hypothetical protein [Streptomyces sp. DSM 44917]